VVFADGANVPDLEQQLDASAELILARGDDRRVIFDRCPLDFVAYLEIVSEGEGTSWEPSGKQLARIEKALASLDLLVFLPLSRPDEIAVEIEFPKLRANVDARLKRWLQPDNLAMLVSPAPRLLALRGTRDERLARLLAIVDD